MIRIVKMTGKFYGVELPEDKEKAMEEIENFVDQGTPVIIVDDVDELQNFDIYDKVIMVEREEDDE